MTSRTTFRTHGAPRSDGLRRRGAAAAMLLLVALFLASGCAAVTNPSSPAGQPPPPQLLFNQAFPAGCGSLRATLDREVYPPHYAGAWHTHPGPGSFCTIHGTLTIERRDQSAVTLPAGACWAETPGVVHRPANRTDQEAIALFYLLASDGQPRTLPAPTATP